MARRGSRGSRKNRRRSPAVAPSSQTPARENESAPDTAAYSSDPSTMSESYLQSFSGYEGRLTEDDILALEGIDDGNARARSQMSDQEYARRQAARAERQQVPSGDEPPEDEPRGEGPQETEDEPPESPRETSDEEPESQRDEPSQGDAGEPEGGRYPEGSQGDLEPESDEEEPSSRDWQQRWQSSTREAQALAEELKANREERGQLMQLIADLSSRGREASAEEEPPQPQITNEQFFDDPLGSIQKLVAPMMQQRIQQAVEAERQRAAQIFDGQRRLGQAFSEIEERSKLAPDQQQLLRSYLQQPAVTQMVRSGDYESAADIAFAFYLRDHGAPQAPRKTDPRARQRESYVAGANRGRGARSRTAPQRSGPSQQGPKLTRQGLSALSDNEFEAVVERVSGRPLPPHMRLGARGF